MKILLTGATGFIGQNLLEVLCLKHNITILCRNDSKLENISHLNYTKFIYTGESKELIDLFVKEKFDGVVHLASLFLASHKSDDISSLVSSNITFGTHILEAAKDQGCKWFLNTGTFWQHYQDSSYDPVNLYAATKQAFECLAKYYIGVSDLKFVTLKLSDTYGRGDSRPKILNLFDKLRKNNNSLEMSHGDQVLSITHIDDVVSAFICLISNLESNDSIKAGDDFNI